MSENEGRCEELDFSARTRLLEILSDEYAEVHKRRTATAGGGSGISPVQNELSLIAG